MPLEIDWYASLIKVTSPTTEVDGQTLHDFIEDTMASPVGLLHSDIIQPEGKIEDPTNPGIYTQIIIVLNSPWQIQFWGGSGYTRIYGAKIVGGLSDQPLKATGTAGDISVLESPVDGVYVQIETGTSGLTTEESQALLDIAAAQDVIESAITTINSNISSMSTSITGIEADITTINSNITSIYISIQQMYLKSVELEGELLRCLGMMQENFSMDQQTYTTYQGQKLLTSARIRLYGSKANVGTDNGVLHTYRVEAAWSGLENTLYNVRWVSTTTTTTTTT